MSRSLSGSYEEILPSPSHFLNVHCLLVPSAVSMRSRAFRPTEGIVLIFQQDSTSGIFHFRCWALSGEGTDTRKSYCRVSRLSENVLGLLLVLGAPGACGFLPSLAPDFLRFPDATNIGKKPGLGSGRRAQGESPPS